MDKLDVADIIRTALERLAKQDGAARYQLRRLVNGYRRFDATRGMQYVLDLRLLDRSIPGEVSKRVHLLRPLGNIEIVPMPYVTENTRVRKCAVYALNACSLFISCAEAVWNSLTKVHSVPIKTGFLC